MMKMTVFLAAIDNLATADFEQLTVTNMTLIYFCRQSGEYEQKGLCIYCKSRGRR